MCDEPLTHSEIYHHAPWFISIFVQGRRIIAPYSPRHTSFQALVDVAVHHQWQHNLEKLYDSILVASTKIPFHIHTSPFVFGNKLKSLVPFRTLLSAWVA